jgi:hypothetical protein
MRIHLGSPGHSSEPTERLAMHPIVRAPAMKYEARIPQEIAVARACRRLDGYFW